MQSYPTAQLCNVRLTNCFNFRFFMLANISIDGRVLNDRSVSSKTSWCSEQSPEVANLDNESGILFVTPGMWNA
ncbi:MAG: hypothetical protein EZS28_053253 [Streblomastix strix]|uniref:Uncharacterized protein n=1 Tax=Streblomastix strix TaxID=222440 RepID=A0A5J4RF14_9EUKA|nr:MAG: hypothetical protein EZS28_053253 [Streblomastix strix]